MPSLGVLRPLPRPSEKLSCKLRPAGGVSGICESELSFFPGCFNRNTDMKMLSDPNTNVHEIIHEIGELLSLVQGLYKKGVWYQ